MSSPNDITATGSVPSPSPARPRRGWSAGNIAAASAGGIIGVVSLGLALVGAVLALAFAFGRDDDGYFTTDREALRTTTPALTAEGVQIGDLDIDEEWVIDAVGGKVRVSADGTGNEPVFIGIARERDLDAYLAGVAHDRVDDFGTGGPDYDRTAGESRAARPADQDIWVASSAGRGEQTATWEVREGDWAVAVLNADGSPGVAADVRAGARADWVLWAGLGLLVVGLAGFGGGLALTAAGVRRGEG